MIKTDPNTNQRVAINPLFKDTVEYPLINNDIIQNEDQLNLGSVNNISAPLANKLWGTNGWIDGEKDYNRTSRGNKADIVITKQRYGEIKNESKLFEPL
jgi:hypothetical protein